jgi:hypothetical protein
MSIDKMKQLHDDAQDLIKDTRRMLEEAKAMIAKIDTMLNRKGDKHE